MALSADSLDENGLCRICGAGESPCCNVGHCEALAGEQVSAMCVHCGSELIELDGAWYHHSQFEQDFLGQPQDYLSKKTVGKPNMVCEYDVWSDNDGRIRSTIANKPIVDDSDAPYAFSKHEIRVSAANRKDAIKQFRLATKAK